ncbi:MAG: hypothetical protein JST84_05390 [Acidobacteria bacterium]|nr:hypothetical protein [Acidobacteriota bacterium]
MKTQFKIGAECGNSAHTIYLRDTHATVARLNGGGDVIAFQFASPCEAMAFTLGAETSPAALVVESTLLKQWAHQDFMENPFPVMAQDLANHHNFWRKTTEERWTNLLGAVPPLHQNGNRFLCSEPYTHRDGQPVYAAGLVMEGNQHLLKYQTEKQYHHERLNTTRRIERTGDEVKVNGTSGLLLSVPRPDLNNKQLVKLLTNLHLYGTGVWIERETAHFFIPNYNQTNEILQNAREAVARISKS